MVIVGYGSKALNSSKFRFNAFMHTILYSAILYFWEYAICPYGHGHMPHANMVIYPYEYIYFLFFFFVGKQVGNSAHAGVNTSRSVNAEENILLENVI